MNKLTPEILVDLAVPGHAAISPDGDLVVFAVTSASRRDTHPLSSIWIVPSDGNEPARQVSAGTANDTAPQWSIDGQEIAFLSDRNERGTAQLFLLPMSGGEARPLTEVPGGVSGFQWIPGDNRRIAYLEISARDKDEQRRRDDERDDANVWGEFWPHSRLRLLDIDSGQVREYDVGDRHVASILPSQDGSTAAIWMWANPELDEAMDRSQLGILDLESRHFEEVGRPSFHPGSATWSSDGTSLYYVGRGGPTAVSSHQIWRRNLAAGTDPVCVTSGMNACAAGIARPQGGSTIYAIIAEGTESWIGRLDDESGTVAPIHRFEGDLSSLSVSRDGRTIAVLGSTADRPADVHVFQDGANPKRVSDLHASLDGIELGEQEIVHWHRNGFDLDGILIWPPGKSRADAPLPTIVSIHGGPYGRWPNAFIAGYFGRRLADEGYLVFLPNPRGGFGHGEAFAESVLHSVGDEDYLDIMAGVDLLVDQGLADADRLGCGGWSQGGFMTAWVVGHTDRFKAGVMGAGVSDWGMMIATSDIPTYEHLMGGGDPYGGVGPHRFDRQSPVSYIHNVKTPVLIVHGENDARVPVTQGIFFHRGLRKHNVPTEMVTYPREPHGIQERNHQLDLHRRIVDWYQRWIPVE